jgi:CheY-like chemotaxis protein/HPt (histidine-containing phosphotransfer) domain-containing protein
VVESNDTARATLVELLNSAGLAACGVASGQEARARVEKSGPEGVEIVLLSWRLGGDVTAGQLLDDWRMQTAIPRERFVVLASQADAAEAHAALRRLGIGALRIKPASPSKIFDALAHAFDAEQRSRGTKSAERMAVAACTWRGLRGVRVLVVEDNPINQDVAAAILRHAGVEVEVSGEGHDAIARVRAALDSGRGFQAVLMDRHMPGMDGLETTRAIRSDPRCEHLPIIAMTADAIDGSREECLRAGLNDFVSKPCVPDLLYQTIARWTGRKRGDGSDPAPPPNGSTPETQATLPGIAVDEGLARVAGDAQLYDRLLRRFRAEYAGVDQKIATLLREGRRDDAMREAHTLKGLAGNLGARELHEAAAGLETAIRSGDVGGQAAAELSRWLDVVMDGLAGLDRESTPGAGPAEPPPPSARWPVHHERRGS